MSKCHNKFNHGCFHPKGGSLFGIAVMVISILLNPVFISKPTASPGILTKDQPIEQTALSPENQNPQTQAEWSLDLMDIIISSPLIVQITLWILVFMSILSWAIILSKKELFKSNYLNNQPLKDVFFKANSLDNIYEICKTKPKSTLGFIFRSGYTELKKMVSTEKKEDTRKEGLLSGIDNLERALNQAVNNEISAMERKLPLLATIGSISPFIGLLGTVFGIMDAFGKIGSTGSASLQVLAPSISEALIATGLGLFVAIPATAFYNHYIAELRKAELQFSNFTTDFLNISKRNFFK